MISSILALALTLPTDNFSTEKVPDKILRYCSAFVQVPYASDNLTDEEWLRFKDCARMQMEEKNK